MEIKHFFLKKHTPELFWNWFEEQQDIYYYLTEEQRDRLYAKLERRLKKVNPELIIEFGAEAADGKRELMISADGITSAFADVIKLTESAPALERFSVIPFRQPLSEAAEVTIDDVSLTRDDVYFTCLAKHQDGTVDLDLYIKGYDEENEYYVAAAFLLLDGLIGEYTVGTQIKEIDFKPYAEKAELLPITELPPVFGTQTDSKKTFLVNATG